MMRRATIESDSSSDDDGEEEEEEEEEKEEKEEKEETLSDPAWANKPTTIPREELLVRPSIDRSVYRCDTPIDYFKLFMTDQLIQTLCDNSIAYAALKLESDEWTVTPEEIQAYIGCHIEMGILHFPRL